MKKSFNALTRAGWRFMTAATLVVATGCTSQGALDGDRPVTRNGDGPRGRTPAEERVIAGVAEVTLTDRAWPDFDQAYAHRINTVADGAPLYVHLRTLRPLQELAHPADPNATAAFARYPYLLLQIGDVDSMRIINTCYVTLTPDEGRRNELVVALAPMVRLPGNSPTDCWLASVASQPPGRLRQEVRLAGFAGKFERWLPVPDILGVAPIDADLTAGSALYSAMLRSAADSGATTAAAASPGSSLTPAPGVAGGAGAAGGTFGGNGGSASRSRPAGPASLEPAPSAAGGAAVIGSGAAVGASSAIGTASSAASPVSPSVPPSVPAPGTAVGGARAGGPNGMTGPAGAGSSFGGGGAVPPAPSGSSGMIGSGPGAGASGVTPAPVPTPIPSPYPSRPALSPPSPVAGGGQGGGSVSAPSMSAPSTSAPIVVATPVAPSDRPRSISPSNVPLRAAMGGDRLEAQLQALATALLGRRPTETFFIDDFWVPSVDPRGRVIGEQAYAAAVFKGGNCSWARLRVMRRPGGANIADLERAGDYQDVSCDSLR